MEMKKTKNLTQIVLAGALSVVLSACGYRPEVKECKDLTGDGITDILIKNNSGDDSLRGNYLFIGKEDGTFIRTKEFFCNERTRKGTSYFYSEDEVAYFFDGKFYQKAEKENEQQ